ncbi:MAG: GNAT family N-acetyltransferase [Candidatus Rokubacteria bacterium]|nr:GNAT family N-acetyltransferase [Candidatus Rokubacteria bacterium]
MAAPARAAGDATPSPRHGARGRARAPGVSVVETPDALTRLDAIWEELAGSDAPPTQQAAWARACLAAFSDARHTPYLVVAGTGAGLAIAPMMKHAGAVARLEMLGMAALQEPMDFLYASPDAVPPLARALARSRLPVVLRRVPAASPVVAALRDAYRGRGLVLVRPAAPSPCIALDTAWRDPMRRLEPRRRGDLRRARRRAAEHGPVRPEILAPTPHETPGLLDDAIRIEASGWKRHARTALLLDNRRRAFFRHYAMEASERGALRVCFLRLGGLRVAMQLAVEAAGAFWLLKIGYDDGFRRCSPGTLLMAETVRHAAARGLRAYELLGTVEPWTAFWTRHARPAVSVRAYPASPGGLAAFATDLAAAAGRRLARRVSRCT